jgi:hypothetical protein
MIRQLRPGSIKHNLLQESFGDEDEIAREVERYLRTGLTDSVYSAWPGSFLDRANLAHQDLRGALLRKVQQLAVGRSTPPLPLVDTVALTRAKVEPMVRGLFPRVEQGAILAMLEKSVVFVTSGNIEDLLLGPGFDSSAWTFANLYLASLNAPLLADDAPSLVGVSEEGTCYLSTDYFSSKDPFADFVVHEAAHTFHNCKRSSVGLRETRTRCWLLNISFRRRETFAYCCEAYARILEQTKGFAKRRVLADEFARRVNISDDRVDRAEVVAIIYEAVKARNGWKVILERMWATLEPNNR